MVLISLNIEEAVQLFVGPETDHKDIIKKTLIEHQWADTVCGKLLSSLLDVNIHKTHEDVRSIWRRPGSD